MHFRALLELANTDSFGKDRYVMNLDPAVQVSAAIILISNHKHPLPLPSPSYDIFMQCFRGVEGKAQHCCYGVAKKPGANARHCKNPKTQKSMPNTKTTTMKPLKCFYIFHRGKSIFRFQRIAGNTLNSEQNSLTV